MFKEKRRKKKRKRTPLLLELASPLNTRSMHYQYIAVYVNLKKLI
jgi:hypothetical protein